MKVLQIELNERDIIEAAKQWLRSKQGPIEELEIIEFGHDDDMNIVFKVVR